jgi:hypothetical protein
MQALAYAQRGWPVFPCWPGQKNPMTDHGFKDATTDPARIRAWWAAQPDANVAIATGAPGPDVLDVDVRPEGNGFAAYNRLKRAGLLYGASALVRTRAGGLHAYYAGTAQTCGKLPRHFLDFKAAGGYVIAPPSFVEADDRGPAGFYELLGHRPERARINWQAAKRLLDPPQARQPRFVQPRRHSNGNAESFDGVIRYLSGLKDGDQRWKQLYWGACTAARMVAAGKLDKPAARKALMAAAQANGFTDDHGEKQAICKIDRGLRDGAR